MGCDSYYSHRTQVVLPDFFEQRWYALVDKYLESFKLPADIKAAKEDCDVAYEIIKDTLTEGVRDHWIMPVLIAYAKEFTDAEHIINARNDADDQWLIVIKSGEVITVNLTTVVTRDEVANMPDKALQYLKEHVPIYTAE